MTERQTGGGGRKGKILEGKSKPTQQPFFFFPGFHAIGKSSSELIPLININNNPLDRVPGSNPCNNDRTQHRNIVRQTSVDHVIWREEELSDPIRGTLFSDTMRQLARARFPFF